MAGPTGTAEMTGTGTGRPMMQPVCAPNVRALTVLNAVGLERIAQNAKWGVQHHRTEPPISPRTAGSVISTGTSAKTRPKTARLPGATLFQEEISKALAETDPVKLRAELIQAAAVLAAWIEDIDFRRSGMAYITDEHGESARA